MKFLRRSADRYSKLGKGRKKKQRWKKPTGRDNKMREKRRGYPAVVSIGYGSAEKKEQIVVNNLKDLENAKGEVVLGKIGKKKKIEFVKKAKEKGIKFSNLNIEKFLKEIEAEEKKKAEKKVEEAKKKGKDKKPAKKMTGEEAKKIIEKERERKESEEKVKEDKK